MRSTLTCLPILAALAVPAWAQSNSLSGPIPEGKAYFCAYMKSETKIGDKVVGAPSEKFGGKKFSGSFGVILSDSAYHCTRNNCYRFTRSPALSQTTQVYIDDSDGTRLITNALAIEMTGGVMFESSLQGVMAITQLSGECRLTTPDKVIEVFQAVGKTPPKSKR
jgi:hypothetical protein